MELIFEDLGTRGVQDGNATDMERLRNVEQMESKCETVESSRVHPSQSPHQSSSSALDPERHNKMERRQ